MRRRISFRIPCLLLAVMALVGGEGVRAGQHDAASQTGRFEMLVLAEGGSATPPPGFRTGGVMHFQPAAPTFDYSLRAHGLRPRERYTLAYLPEPRPGDGLVCLGSATANQGGALSLDGSLDLNGDLPARSDANHPDGARIVLALAADVDCIGRVLRDWRPGSYLVGRSLIAYHDTDQAPDYSGTYCMITQRTGATSSFEMQLAQSGTSLTVTVEGITLTGSLSGATAVLTGTTPDGPVTLAIAFASDGMTFAGTLSIGTVDVEERTVSGTRGRCWDYAFPAGDPVCGLPVPDTGLVTGGQQFNSVFAGVTHQGLDFQFASPLPAIVAPCDGVVIELNRHAISLGNLVIDVVIRYNADWTTFLAFEPYSPDPAIADEQEAQIDVAINQVVRQGDVIGRLVVPGTAYPHVHWGVTRSDAERTPVCPRDYTVPTARTALDALYGRLGLVPVCLPSP